MAPVEASFDAPSFYAPWHFADPPLDLARVFPGVCPADITDLDIRHLPATFVNVFSSHTMLTAAAALP
jgi:hypothetical protein